MITASNLNKMLQKSKVLYEQARFEVDNVCVQCREVVTLCEDQPYRNQQGRIVCEECRNPPPPEVLAARNAAAEERRRQREQRPPFRVTVEIKQEPEFPALGSFV